MTEIKLDYDGAFPADFWMRVGVVCRAHRLRILAWRRDRTRHGWHVVIYVVNRCSFQRVVLLQALMGSDWKREMFNSRRALAWRRVPVFWRTRANVLYDRHTKGVVP